MAKSDSSFFILFFYSVLLFDESKVFAAQD